STYVPAWPTSQIGFFSSNCPIHGTSRMPPAIMAARYVQVSSVVARFWARSDQNDAPIQLISQTIQIISSTWFVGIVTVLTLHSDAPMDHKASRGFLNFAYQWRIDQLVKFYQIFPTSEATVSRKAGAIGFGA